ncbi:MAG: ATP-binding protein [Candidatus Rokuibacteriota bacterium]
MVPFRITLLGGFGALSPSGEPLAIPGRKVRGLLAYLAASSEPRERDSVAALLWGETSDRGARHSLRQALSSLRKTMPGLLTERNAVALNSGLVDVDVARFERLARQDEPGALEEAARLYRGPFLAGFDGGGGASFEEWRSLERDRLGELALDVLARLLADQMRRDALELAIQTALRILSIDPLQEVVHRTLMRLFARQGRRAAALHQYQQCVGWVRRELGIEPEEETRELYRELLRSQDPGGALGLVRRPPGDGLGGSSPDGSMVGRVSEIESLREAVERTRGSGARVMMISGEAGIGKTRLIQELTGEASRRGIRVLSAVCHETEQPLPFRPWVDALRSESPIRVTEVADRLTPAARRLLGRVFPELSSAGEPGLTTTDEHGLLFEAMGEVVQAVASGEPVIIVLEDLHWADTMSTRLLGFLGRRLRAVPVLIVGSARPEDAVELPVLERALAELRAAGRLEDIALGGLNREESLVLARALFRKRSQGLEIEALADELWALSEGNPFVIVETVRALDSGILVEGGPLLVASVRQAVAVRLARLPELPRRAVAVAAIIGRSFSFRLLQEAAGLGEAGTATAVEELVRRRILDGVGEALDFCHARIRRVAYEEILPAWRAALHDAVARAIESLNADHLDDVADQLGHHFRQAGHADKALAYLKRFAGIAARRYALDTALAALRQASEVVDRLPAADRDGQRLDLTLRQAFVMSTQGRQREILDLLSSQAECVERVADPVLVSEYYFRLALTQFYLGDYSASQLAAQHAQREGERAGDAGCMGKALYVLVLDSYGLGTPQRGITEAMRAIPLLDRPPTQYWLGFAYFGLALNAVVGGVLDVALDAAERARGIGVSIHDSRLMAGGSYVVAWVQALRAECEVAIETARHSMDVARDCTATALATGSLGLAHLERGDADAAVPVLQEAVQQLIGIPLRQGIVRHLVYLSEAYLLAGEVARAVETVQEAARRNQDGENPFNMGLVERALGRIAQAARNSDEAQARLSSALAGFERCGASFEAGRTRVELGELAAARGDTEIAAEHARVALAAFDLANAPKRAAAARLRARAWSLRVGEGVSGVEARGPSAMVSAGGAKI